MGDLHFSESALKVLQKRYLLKDPSGRLLESPDQMLARVARAVALPEKAPRRRRWERSFLDLMASGRFLPNSPTLMNAGKELGQLSACFVLPIEDSLGSIFGTLGDSAKIHQSGGGTGFSFSRIRPSGSPVASTHGVATGPVSFIRVFDVATETIKQGGARRGANMAVLSAEHPDALEFVRVKRDFNSVLNFNLSVGISNAFMARLQAGEAKANFLFDEIVESAHACGDPGLVFLDRMNLFNPTPKLGEFEATNPCGEQPLLAYESCNLGSLNVGAYVTGVGGSPSFEWEELAQDVGTAVRFLDNVITQNVFPVEQSRKVTHHNRKIGLGIMGLADVFLYLGISYESQEAVSFGQRIMALLEHEGRRASVELARERGAFPGYRGSLWEKLGYPKLRNATVTTVAPTGTISLLVGASSGIEPIFSGEIIRNVLSGERLQDVHPAVARLLKARPPTGPSGFGDSNLRALLGKAWSPADSISVEGHLKMQAVVQRHSDSAVSKTINLPEAATRADIRRAYLRAFDLGCKGITVFRSKSRPSQVLERPEYCPTC